MPHISRIWLSLELSLPAAVLDARLTVKPRDMAQALATATQDYVAVAQLSYYPALAHIHAEGYCPPALWNWVEQNAHWLEVQTRYLLRRSLAPLFSSLEIEQLQPRAYTLARVRPYQPNAETELIRHLTLDTLHGVLRLSHISKQPPETGTLERFIRQRVRQNLLQQFASATILHVRVES